MFNIHNPDLNHKHNFNLSPQSWWSLLLQDLPIELETLESPSSQSFKEFRWTHEREFG